MHAYRWRTVTKTATESTCQSWHSLARAAHIHAQPWNNLRNALFWPGSRGNDGAVATHAADFTRA